MKNGDIIRKHCLPEESLDEFVQKCTEVFSNNFTIEDALDIISVAVDEAKEHEEDTKEWDFLTRVTWVIRNAYIVGTAYATNIMFEFIKAAAEEADNEA